RRRHTSSDRDWSSDVCSSDLASNSRGGDMPRSRLAHCMTRGSRFVGLLSILWATGHLSAQTTAPVSVRFGSDTELSLGQQASLPDRKSTRLNSSHDQISYAVF